MNVNDVHQKIAALVAAVSISGMDGKLLCDDVVRDAFIADADRFPRPFEEWLDMRVSLCNHDVELSVRCFGTLFFGHYVKVVLNKDKITRALLFIRKTIVSIKELLPPDGSASYLDLQDIRNQVFEESGLKPELRSSYDHVFRHSMRMLQKPSDSRSLFSAFTSACVMFQYVSII